MHRFLAMTDSHAQKSKTYLRLSEAAELAHVSSATLRRWADAGKVPYVRTPGGERRFLRSSVEALLTPGGAK